MKRLRFWLPAFALALCVLSFQVMITLSAQGVSAATPIENTEQPETPAPDGSSPEAEADGRNTFFSFLPLVLQPLKLYLPYAAHYTLEQPFPISGATEQSLNTYLTWQFNDKTLPNPRYAVYFAAHDSTPDELVVANLQRPNFVPGTLELDTQYYWRVIAVGSDGRHVLGPVWTFRTDPPFDPSSLGKMVTVPEGEFMMGCDRRLDGCRTDEFHEEEPLHAVYLDAYKIDKYEVTNREYGACVAKGICSPPRRFRSLTRDAYFGNPEYDLFPVLYVSRTDAITYCSSVGKRLPTEAEWEKAARGAIDTRTWPWGAGYEDCSRIGVVRGKPCAPLLKRDMVRVGSFPRGASPYGAVDMAGNAFEWVSDKYNLFYYAVSPYRNPQGPEFSQYRRRDYGDRTTYYTIRGGSNVDNWFYMRIAHRHFGHWGDMPMTDVPHFRSWRVGFRCAQSLPDETLP
jgi:formylglycine-generating enzyme required for sulfatase activity